MPAATPIREPGTPIPGLPGARAYTFAELAADAASRRQVAALLDRYAPLGDGGLSEDAWVAWETAGAVPAAAPAPLRPSTATSSSAMSATTPGLTVAQEAALDAWAANTSPA